MHYMILVVGLGNPGERYQNTRHNTGFYIVDNIYKAINGGISSNLDLGNKGFKKDSKSESEVFKKENIILAKPITFMNNSGEAVVRLKSFYKVDISDLYVIHDDLDLRLGDYKIQKSVGPKLHYGLQSVEEKLGTKDFTRIRVGVDNRNTENRIAGEDYVLQNFNDEELLIINNVSDNIYSELIKILDIKLR